ncbi:Ribosome-binding factor A [compost metagenome]|uniref:Ribosome-binding factor A n=1 Tax=Paenibacillus rhizolycopersici TaxID=2780073 RepID=A0ABS2HC34_9BACL|nr:MULTISPECIES: 30S ribosome-binding factor RbfA [Paenibacillus]MBM6997114.1 30S ribosome-binding factor RbfA [Paenibacillus rhizolycopersici]MUG88346.1 30S ribosome-binding factor RbfA [Paenibacillus timonensis]GIP46620.1 ribosome-binding factor A [Paenibacillus sp. J53TS2]
MAKNRTGRVGEQIKKELSVLIQSELKDPRIGFVTVTGVDVTSDLSQAKVYLSVFGDEEKKNESLKAIEKATGFLRTEIGKRIRLRHTPELIFKIDESIAYGSRIEKILGEITHEHEE